MQAIIISQKLFSIMKNKVGRHLFERRRSDQVAWGSGNNGLDVLDQLIRQGLQGLNAGPGYVKMWYFAGLVVLVVSGDAD